MEPRKAVSVSRGSTPVSFRAARMTQTGKRLPKPMSGQRIRRTADSYANRAPTLADNELITMAGAGEYGLPSYLDAPGRSCHAAALERIHHLIPPVSQWVSTLNVVVTSM